MKIEIRVLQKTTNQPLWNEEAVFDQDSDEEKQKSLNDHHKNISACDVPTEWIPNQVYAWSKKSVNKKWIYLRLNPLIIR